MMKLLSSIATSWTVPHVGLAGFRAAILFAGCISTAWSYQQPEETKTQQPQRRAAWLTNLSTAQSQAKAQGKDVIVHFTGSNWSGWSNKLEQTILSQDEFISEVSSKYILCRLDFPKSKAQQATIPEANQRARKTYCVSSFPTVILMDPDGLPYAHIGYHDIGVKSYLSHIAALQKNKAARDAALSKSENLQGKDKARAIEQALSTIPRRYLHLYHEQIKAIAAADPADTSGFVSRFQTRQTYTALNQIVIPLIEKKRTAEVPAIIDQYIAKHSPKGEALQVALVYKLQAAYSLNNTSEMEKIADRILKINPATRSARYANMIKKRLDRSKSSK